MGTGEIREKIERLRKKMYTEYAKNPTGKEVLNVSQQLDRVLNEYQSLPKAAKPHH
ncbi:Spo0E family sporulation regulatory protein-aspartic acid phosphatase [Halobacillus seohaensis]|uniref:Spo0E family sporulation regulatory protein-aspartic acid phosphatase n=1 Tax=Halobacillus seohaensis TaxID=447421 RepID=A0ABW2EEL6_9BACI